MKKFISIVLLATILLQSCVAFQKTSVPLNDARNQGLVKVTTTYGKQMEFTNLYIKDSIYYGVTKTMDLRLDESQILKVYLKDTKKSTVMTVFAIIIPLMVIAVAAVVAIGSIEEICLCNQTSGLDCNFNPC